MTSGSSRASYGPDTRFSVRDAQVIHRLIDDEVVMIDLESGNYYTLLGSGTEMWACLVGGMSAGEIVSHLRRSSEGDPQQVERWTHGLLDQLLAEGLIVFAGDRAPQENRSLPPIERAKLTQPVFEKYDDMADLILLDPIHEIDQDEGWPRKPSQAGEVEPAP